MENHSITSRGDHGAVPADDPGRKLAVANPDDPQLRHVFVAGGTYTILVSGTDTQGRTCLIDMIVPDGGGPPPHRHDFEEAFTLLEGELEFTCRGETQTVAAPTTVNVPANAPHQFRNTSGKTVHMLCQCTPAGQDEFFEAVGVPLERRDSPPPQLSKEDQAAKGKLAEQLASTYRTELLQKA